MSTFAFRGMADRQRSGVEIATRSTARSAATSAARALASSSVPSLSKTTATILEFCSSRKDEMRFACMAVSGSNNPTTTRQHPSCSGVARCSKPTIFCRVSKNLISSLSLLSPARPQPHEWHSPPSYSGGQLGTLAINTGCMQPVHARHGYVCQWDRSLHHRSHRR